MKRPTVLSMVSILTSGSLYSDVSIEWASNLNAENAQSDGVTLLDENFVFELGTFVGIEPSADNLDEWSEAWRSFGSATYQEELKRFSNSKALTSNEDPFDTSSRAYIWGHNGSLPGSEWILIGKSDWTWPVAQVGGPPPFPTRWFVSQTEPGDAIFGAVKSEQFHLQTQVAVFEITFEEWAEVVFVEGEMSGRNDDPDEDGRSNFLEFALGSDPKRKDPPFTVGLTPDLEIEIPRASGRAVKWELLASDDLTGFEALDEGFEVTVDDPERLVFRIEQMNSQRRFFRVRATAP